MTTYLPLKLNNREVGLPKAVVSPILGSSTILTNEPWDFVDLFLARRGLDDARFYWRQSREFYDVSLGLSQISAPLPLYYSFLNAVKALLVAKSIAWTEGHGLCEWLKHADLITLSKGVTLKTWGVAHALSDYYGETEVNRQHTLKDVFFNLPYIHRTFSVTNEPLQEMFIPIVSPHLVFLDGTLDIRLKARLTANFPNSRYCSVLPATFVTTGAVQDQNVLSRDSVTISSVSAPTEEDCRLLCQFLARLREDVVYINGVDTLWYLKAIPTSGVRICRQTTTLTLAGMHRLSEESRYHPMRLAKCLQGQNNWLVSEFIKMSGVQFIDEIAAEITGKQCLRPNVRAAG